MEPCFICDSNAHTERIFPRGVMFGDVFYGHRACAEAEGIDLLDGEEVEKFLADEAHAIG